MNEELKKKLIEAKTDEERRAILDAYTGTLTDEELAEISGGDGCICKKYCTHCPEHVPDCLT